MSTKNPTLDLRDAREAHALLSEAETLSNVGSWAWDVARDRWSFSDHWHVIHGTDGRALTMAELMPLAHPDDAQMINAALANTLETHVSYDIEHRIVRECDGDVRHVRALGRVHTDAAGNVVKVLGATQDITREWQDRERLRTSTRNLERSNDELLQFSYRTSHDLKSPLTTIRGLAEFMLEDINSGNLLEAKRNAKIIIEQTSSLEQFVLDLLDIARSGIEEHPPESIDLEKMVDEVVSSHDFLITQNNVFIAKDVRQTRPHKLPRVLVQQILTNLLSNAVKFFNAAKPRCNAEIRVTDDDDGVMIVVSDNGLGIPGNGGDAVFDLFSRYHGRDLSGSGIGLYMVRQNAMAMGGEVAMQTSNEGTTMTVTLTSQENVS
ncbi:MAG: ATP-binding protein [Gammaproteobacteria bacterium]